MVSGAPHFSGAPGACASSVYQLGPLLSFVGPGNEAMVLQESWYWSTMSVYVVQVHTRTRNYATVCDNTSTKSSTHFCVLSSCGKLASYVCPSTFNHITPEWVQQKDSWGSNLVFITTKQVLGCPTEKVEVCKTNSSRWFRVDPP